MIRPAVPSDARVIAQFNHDLAWETERRRLDPRRVLPGVRAVLRDRSKGIYFVAATDETPIGQLLITYEWSDWRNGVFWWIQSVYVAPEHRTHGAFTALFDHVRRLAARRRNVCGLRLYMESGNSIARCVYQKRGMRNAGYEVFEIDFVARRRKD